MYKRQGYVDTLQIKKEFINQKERDDYLAIISNSANKLSKLINQLFEYSKLEAAKQLSLSKEPFSLVDLVLDLISSNKVLASEKGISIKLKSVNHIPLVFADLGLVERAIQNLIDNAIKFTPEGGLIEFQVNASAENVSVKISDNGIGIKESEIAVSYTHLTLPTTSRV